MTAIHLLALAGYFIVLFEYIAMRHRVICAESDLEIIVQYDGWIFDHCTIFEYWPKLVITNRAVELYWDRGTK